MNASPQSNASLPALPVVTGDADTSKELLHHLRHFHLGNPEAQEKLQHMGSESLPALLEPFRDSRRLRYAYPLFLTPPAQGTEDISVEDLARPLSAYLHDTVKAFAPTADAARILKDSLPWIERELRLILEGEDQDAAEEGPQAALPLLQKVADQLLEHLDLDSANQEKLANDLQQLLQAIPEESELLGYGYYPAIHLLIHVTKYVNAPRLARFRAEVDEAIRGLSQLLAVEKDKSLESIEPANLQESSGPAASLLNANALSELMDHSRGSLAMSPQRKARIEQALATLEAYQDDPILVRFIHRGTLAKRGWLQCHDDLEVISDSDPSARATAIFDDAADRLAAVFAAARIAHLEMQDLYDPSLHDPWFANFHWQGFSEEEIFLVPAVIALEAADNMAHQGMTSFSRLLSSGRPVQILVRVQSHHNPGAGDETEPFSAFRTELGYIGIAHRQAFVAQTSAARHQHLLKGYLEALQTTHTALHLISTGLRTTGNETMLNAWLVAGAALEGRAHPFFRVNPALGDSFADCMNFSQNPHPLADWPTHPFEYLDENSNSATMDLAFTFADYALLMPRLKDHFALIPPACDSADLIIITDYLDLPSEEANQHIPYVWAVDKYGTLQKLVITRTLVSACRDRLDFWHTLQEISGVRNRHVELALAATREQIQAEADAKIKALEDSHETEITAARSEAAGEVMGRLTDVLMGMDLVGGAPRPAPTALSGGTTAEAEAVAEEAAETQEPVAEEEEISFDEPWIDSPLCTSCNDCLVLNPVMFVYNESNQAIITDPGTGTYAQLVEAAELCPSKCIHPGKPTNPSEPGLEDLIARAAPFN